ncbi:unnamed protein product [Rotaria magnacalcarata]|uniref:Endonuclease/exonuclease/phosphatase domain-containing protein n=2 Tax=Rotaria magnacalcarata TaxID=392030 RepID=A0A816UC22_9BILA|nr:unnamed protein product [Rotaria magnacalcarata]CAF4760006.1 unnamed protein product [Rotaria magnacalcarata]
MIKLEVAQSNILLGAVYIPPKDLPPLELFEVCKDREFFLFGNFNAKHTAWLCKSNNSDGVEIKKWLDETGYEGIFSQTTTSKRSDAIIDFAIGYTNVGWSSEVLNIGTSDHFPVLFSSPIVAENTFIYQKTNWNLFTYFLSCVFQYWNACVYNIDEQQFFILFSNFLKALWDRTSTYEINRKYRPPWPPHLVSLAKQINYMRGKYRRTHFLIYLEEYKQLKYQYRCARTTYEQEKRENQLKYLTDNKNIWKIVKPTFHPYLPSFRGLKNNNGEIIRDSQKVADHLGNYFEKHFSKPLHDSRNNEHIKYLKTYEQIVHLPKMPLEPIEIAEVYKQWCKISAKKSTDIFGISAFLLKNIPIDYMSIFTIMFNKCISKGEFLEAGKIAKVICLSKEGIYPTENRLRPISLLPNISKLFERCLHTKILKWCESEGIYIDEQSGFTPNRRLQTRILTICEDIRLTIAAPNRPILGIFVDFMTAFGRMRHPVLISNLKELDMPLNLIRFIHEWLIGRSMNIQYGGVISKK